MARKRWIYIGTEAVEVSDDYIAPSRDAKNFICGDRHYDGLCATDGADISTRAKHREYMRAHGYTTADDYKNEWANAEKERTKFYTGEPTRDHREAVERAFHKVVHEGYRPKLQPEGE